MTSKLPAIATIAAIAALSLSGAAQADGLMGTRVVVTNTFQGERTKNVETDAAFFGPTNNIFVTTGEGVELPSFITIYDVDISENAINFTFVDSEFSRSITGPTPAGNHDRNYFVFDMADGMEIKSIEFDVEHSGLLEGSTLPTALRISGNKVVTVFSEGVVRGLGFNPAFSLVVGPTE